MKFHSLLFDRTQDRIDQCQTEVPEFFRDLNLDQIIDFIVIGREEYNLKPFFYTSIQNMGTIKYRQEIMKDIEDPALYDAIKSFSHKMRKMREQITQLEKFYYKYQKERLFLDAVEIYCEAIARLTADLSAVEFKSRGLTTFREYLNQYAHSVQFTSLVEEMEEIKTDLSKVNYCLLIKGNTIKVRKYAFETDYSEEVENTFQKFRLGAVKDYSEKFSDYLNMNHVEAKILDFVAQLYPDLFQRLDLFCTKNQGYLDRAIGHFDREVQFYVVYQEFMSIFKRNGLKFCYPKMINQSKEIYSYAGYDLSLAKNLISEHLPVICNDFFMKDDERIFVVSGPNQGGKTTFARTFGQLHYLASLGLPVPGKKAQLFLFDHLYTHFEKEEDIKNLRGKLEDDLVRIFEILKQATSESIIIMNEIFTSTTLKDALFLGKKVMERIIQLDSLCVCVTFLDELASSKKTVSMVSTVIPDNPSQRTYKIIRRPADGLAYAISIAEKYRLTYDQIKERIQL